MKRAKLLIVDDEPQLCNSMSFIFTAIGHTVRTAADGFSALVEIRKEMPGLILSDLNMPGMSGFEFLSVVRRRFPAIRVIAMSGAFIGEDIPDGVAADAFYEKGSQLKDLLQLVEAMTSSEGPPGRHHSLERTPLWIPTNGHDPSGAEFVMINCPECLRSFPQVLGETICPIYGTSCIFCNALIHFALVPEPMATHPRSLYALPDPETQAPIGPTDPGEC